METFESYTPEAGAVWVSPTDTVIGMSARISDVAALDRIKELKGAREGKGFIVLISKFADLETLGISVNDRQSVLLEKIWPAPVSVIFSLATSAYAHLGVGDNTLAVRMPERKALRAFIERVGPIVSTSANRSGDKPAETVEEAREIFKTDVDVYIEGVSKGEASTIIRIVR